MTISEYFYLVAGHTVVGWPLEASFLTQQYKKLNMALNILS